MHRILTSNDYRSMPWKNGLGTTDELAIDPADASPAEPFNWRISIAKVAASGPFSSFPGYDRSITLLGGATMRLHHAGMDRSQDVTLVPLHPHSFSGDDSTTCTIEGSAARDFNVMVRRDFGQSRVTTKVLTKSQPLLWSSRATCIFAYCVYGKIAVRLAGREETLSLDEDDSLEINPYDPGEDISLAFSTLHEEVALVIVEITAIHRPLRRRTNPRLARPETPKPLPSIPPSSLPEPEDFIPAPPKPITPFQIWPRSGSARLAALLILAMTLASGYHWRTGSASNLWVSGRSIFRDHEYYRLFTALLVHGDLVHLAHNAPIFLFFGWVLRAYFGLLAFPALALIIGVLSNLVTVYYYNLDTHVIGASGMIYGMVSLWLTLYAYFDRQSPFPHRVMRTIGFAVLILFPQTYEQNTSYLAHAAGFVLGVVFGLMAIPTFRTSAPVNHPSPSANSRILL